MTTTKPIKFVLGEESRPKIEGYKDINVSLFKDQYNKAFEEIAKYVQSMNRDQTDQDTEHINNIFAFIGERGSGKTSCMLSVDKMLTNENNLFSLEKSRIISEHKFISIDLIDPSFFDDTHNILDIVIAKLFKSFNETLKSKTPDNAIQDKLNLKQKALNNFQETNESLRNLLKGKKHEDFEGTLEQLASLAAAVDLKKNIKELVDSYLKYDNNQNSFLVLKIDDIDLNTKHAYVMVEQIRKYLIQPNIIILMSVKLDQLANVIKLQFHNEYKSLEDEKINIQEMVDKYLVKLIPLNARIFLPDANVFVYQPLEICTSNGQIVCEYNSIREAIPSLIFKKTRYLFYNTKGTTSYIVPLNLRELRFIVKMLFQLEDYRNGNERPEYNKTIFKRYLFESWVDNHLSLGGKKIIENILQTNDAVKLNKKVIDLLKEYFNTKDSIEQQSEIEYITSRNNQSYNISLGDILAFLSFIEGFTSNEQDLKLIFMIKSIYSIKLYEYYDEITETQLQIQRDEQEVFKYEFMRGYSNYDKLVAGNFINTNYFALLPQTKNNRSRTQRNINGDIIQKLLNALLKSDSESIIFTSAIVEDKIKKHEFIYLENSSLKEPLILNRTQAINLVEFFALTTTRKYYSKDKNREDQFDKNYRSRRDIYYTEELKQQNITFDITSIFFNILNYQRTYSRFDSHLFEIASKEDDSILRLINKKLKNDFNTNDEQLVKNRFLSQLSIRNFEILEAFTNELTSNKPESTGENKTIIRAFFDFICKFTIATYDYKDETNDSNKDKYHHIKFEILECIVKFLDELDSKIFELIYTKEDSDNESNINKLKSKLNIRIALKRNGKYLAEIIWSKLMVKNQDILTESHKILFDSIFINKSKQYNQNEANNLLELFKSRLNG